MERGFYVEPTVVGDLPASHRLFRDELFAPFTAVAAVDSLDEAIALANDSVYGLTAGVYSEDPAEVQQFLDRIQAGVAVRQPARRRDDRRVAGRPGVRRLEGERLDRQGRAVDVLRRAVHARAEPHHRRLAPRRAPDARVGACAPSLTHSAVRSLTVLADVSPPPWPRPPSAPRGSSLRLGRRPVGYTPAEYPDCILVMHRPVDRGGPCRPRRASPETVPSRTSSPSCPARRPGRTSPSTRPGRRPACRAPIRSCRSAARASRVEDIDGNLFLDFAAGIAVNSTGHSHPQVVAAIKEQAAELIHFSASDFYLPIYAEVCQRARPDRADRRAGAGLPRQLRRRGRSRPRSSSPATPPGGRTSWRSSARSTAGPTARSR